MPPAPALRNPRVLNPLGAILAALGALLALWAYSGDRVYDLTYLGLAFFGGVLVVAGVGVLSVVRASADKAGRKTAAAPAAPLAGPRASHLPSALLAHRVECPRCKAIFVRVGQAPFETTCPRCGASGSVG